MRASIFPSWAPPAVVEMWREELDAAIAGSSERWQAVGDPLLVAEYRARAREIPALLFRLLRDPRMAEPWRAIAAAACDERVFAATAIRAWLGPWAEERWTPAERARWARDVQVLAARLGKRIAGTGAEDLLRKAYGTAEFDPGDLSARLQQLGRLAPQLLAPAVLGRPRGREAHRAYFARVLTKYCRACLRSPQRRLVATTAAVALEDEALGERQVQRLAP